MMLLWWIACGTPDPWAGAPALPEEVTQHTSYGIDVRGVPAGIEERWTGTSNGVDVVVRRRTWQVVLGGEPATLRAASRVKGRGPVTGYERWIAGTSTDWQGAAWVPDAVPPPEGGLWPVLEPWTLEVRSTDVSIEPIAGGTVVSWSTSAGTTTARFDADGLLEAEHGAVRMARGKPSGELVAFDPAALFAVPVAPQPSARTSLIGRYEVDGRTVRVDAPTWAEVRAARAPERTPGVDPSSPVEARAWSVVGDAEDQRTMVERLVRDVAQRLDGVPQPGSLAAVDALESGRGDCDEAASAFVAMAKALGLEAETVGGLVYANGAIGPGLYPHAWAKVRLGGRFVAVDPALGQAPADASHLPLGGGAGEAAARLAAGIRVGLVDLR